MRKVLTYLLAFAGLCSTAHAQYSQNICDSLPIPNVAVYMVTPVFEHDHETQIGPFGPDNGEPFEALVFDRWGEILYKSENPMEHYDFTKDGHPLPQGVYVYKITFHCSGEEQNRTGHITLIR